MYQSVFCNKVGGGLGLQLYQKRDSDIGVFLWVLRNFLRTTFYRRPSVAAIYSNLPQSIWS